MSKGRHNISAKAICPFYKYENRNVIYCEGVNEGTVIHIAFANPSECLSYKKQFCRCEHTQCNISKMLISYKYNYN